MDPEPVVKSTMACQIIGLTNGVLMRFIQHCDNYRTWTEATSPGWKVFQKHQTLSWDPCLLVASS